MGSHGVSEGMWAGRCAESRGSENTAALGPGHLIYWKDSAVSLQISVSLWMCELSPAWRGYRGAAADHT